MSIFTSVGTPVSNMDWEYVNARADLDWTVSKRPVYVQDANNTLHSSNKFFATTRDDNNAILGVVGPDYAVCQNYELAYLCERLSGNNGVTIRSAGSLQGGSRVWYQMEGDPFDVYGDDTVIPTVLITNGHNGMWPLNVLPTTNRVFCENTLNMAISQGRKNNMLISIKHSTNLSSRLENLIIAMEEFETRKNIFRTNSVILANKDVSVEFVQSFWTNVYIKMFGDVHSNPSTESEEKDNERAESVMIRWTNTFDYEKSRSGTNLWTAFNAVTNWLDHDQQYRGNNKLENKFVNNLFGDVAKQKIEVFNQALTLV